MTFPFRLALLLAPALEMKFHTADGWPLRSFTIPTSSSLTPFVQTSKNAFPLFAVPQVLYIGQPIEAIQTQCLSPNTVLHVSGPDPTQRLTMAWLVRHKSSASTSSWAAADGLQRQQLLK